MTDKQSDNVIESSADKDIGDATFIENHSKIAALRTRLNNFKLGFFDRLSNMTLSQWTYVVAIVFLLGHSDSESDEVNKLLIAGSIALVGLTREVWKIFTKVWDHTLGKGVLFVLYAATANFALAISALKINVIAGVEPTIFAFTMGFATLLMLPFWLIVASILFMSSLLILGNVWLLVALLLRIIGVKLTIYWEDKSFIVVTLIARIVLIPVVIFTLLYTTKPYLKQMDMFGDSLELHFIEADNLQEEDLERYSALSKSEIDAAVARIRQQELGDAAELPGLSKVTGEQILTNIDAYNAQLKAAGETGEAPQTVDIKGETKFLDTVIAHFIFRFETYQHSRCKKEPEQRALSIDEESVFVAQLDADAGNGVLFSILPCEPDYRKIGERNTPPQTANDDEATRSSQTEETSIEPETSEPDAASTEATETNTEGGNQTP